MLGYLTERTTSTSIKTQETMNIVFFLRETINGENPATSSEIESTPKVKPQNSNDDLLIAVTSFFLALVSSSSSSMHYN